MLEINTLEDIAALRESTDVECKLAQGRDKKGAFPKDAWESYSAFANTQGGDIFLGLRELPDTSFELAGITNTQKVLDEFWTGVRNKEKVSADIMRDRWAKVIEIDELNIIHIHVPRATRKQRPIYIKNNPIGGTYKRFNSADIRLSEEDVRRMLAEQIEDSRDTEMLKGYGLGDLDIDSINAYRQIYTNLQPDHPWNKIDAQDFLYQIGGWTKDRESGESGLTRAGLLMFGTYRPIREAFPNYMVDYQERPEAKTETRWVDRLAPDGSWSGNLFDFYHKVIRKLTADLKVPFVMEGDQRLDDTPVHKSLREALVNTLVHADYSGRSSILVVKRPDMFGFRNPGNMRVAAELATAGNESDCRNRNLQDMFRYIGLGENAGSGLPKIFDGWNSQHWRKPLLKEKQEPSEQTLLELHTLSLVPDQVLAKLRETFGKEVFNRLSDTERLILSTAHIETTVDHARMMSILDIHPRDLSVIFARLVEKELIYQEGSGRGTIYFLAEARVDDAILERDLRSETVKGPEQRSGPLDDRSGGLDDRSGGLEELMPIAQSVASKKKAPKAEVEKAIVALCEHRALRLDELEELLQRSGEFLRKDYLQPLIKDKKIRLLYPTIPNHPHQAYMAIESEK